MPRKSAKKPRKQTTRKPTKKLLRRIYIDVFASGKGKEYHVFTVGIHKHKTTRKGEMYSKLRKMLH